MKKRILAFLIDYLVIVAYGVLLAAVTVGLILVLELETSNITPLKGQLIGFVTMTLPVFLYFYLNERGKNHATLGKRRMEIQVGGTQKAILLRNLLKFLPWEVAHAGVHWVMYYSRLDQDPPVWVWILLVAPQLMVMMYVISILIKKGRSSLYDYFSGSHILNQ